MRELIEFKGIYFLVEEYNDFYEVTVEDEIYQFNDYNSVSEFIHYYDCWGC